jgi:hypothetical protein
MLKIIRYWYVLAAMVFIGCDNSIDQPELKAPDYNYFPLYEGLEWIDSIRQIHIDDPVGVYDTIFYLTKTTIDSIEAVAEFDTNFYCTKYRFDTASQSWNFQNRFWFNRTRTKLLEHDENVTMLRLVFPLSLGTQWNPYSYTVYSDTSLRDMVIAIDNPVLIHGMHFDSTMTVMHQNDSTLIYKYVEKSIFAYNLGKVNYEFISILSDDPNYDFTLPIEEKIKIGDFITLNRYYTNK